MFLVKTMVEVIRYVQMLVVQPGKHSNEGQVEA